MDFFKFLNNNNVVESFSVENKNQDLRESNSYLQEILGTAIFNFSEHPKDVWRLEDAVRGVQIFGGIGSGKSSGSGKALAMKFLKLGYGGLVLCGKPEEAQTWIEYARLAGRKDEDVIHFNEGSKYFFNPLQYEKNRKGKGGGLTSNISNLFITLYKLGQRINGGEAKESQLFWESALKRCLNRVIDLIKMSGEELSVRNMALVVTSIPTMEDMEIIKQLALDDDFLGYGEKNSFCVKCLYHANINRTKDNTKSERDFFLVYNYFFKEFPRLYPETRTTIQEMFLGLAEPFQSGLLSDHFSEEIEGGEHLTPEVTHDGKIIILDFSIKEYLESGTYAQNIFKLLWQQATERRIEDKAKNHLPVFLWVDESQYFISEYDMLFQTTARSSIACTVFISQNISNYYAVMGGESAKARVDSLLGNLSTKIFHSNNDPVTNEWASKVIGDDFTANESGSSLKNTFNLETGSSDSYTMQLMAQVIPLEFTKLLTGGRDCNFEVHAIVTKSGHTWSNGKNYRKLFFKQ